MPQVLEIPPQGGATVPQYPPRRGLSGSAWEILRESPFGIGVGPGMRGSIVRRVEQDPGCDCGSQKPWSPGRQSPYQPVGQDPNRYPGDQGPTGLNQPPGPKKPFQDSSKTPCEEFFRAQGLDPTDLKDCLKPGKSTRGRKKRKRNPYPLGSDMNPGRPRRKAKKSGKSTRSTVRRAQPKSETLRRLGPYRPGQPRIVKLSNGACYDRLKRVFVKRSRCA